MSETNGTSNGQTRNPFEKCVLLNLTTRKMGLTRKANKDLMEVDADKSMTNFSKKLLDCQEIKDINSVCVKIKKVISAISIPGAKFIKEGVYAIPIARVNEVDEELIKLMREFNDSVERFIGVYYVRVQEAMEKLNVLADAKNYPSAEKARQEFEISYSYITLGPPATLQEINQEMWRREKEKVVRECESAVVGVQAAMEDMFLKLVTHMKEVLEPDKEGNKKRFHESNIENFKDFITKFRELKTQGFLESEDLSNLVNQANYLLEGRDVKSLKKDMSEREYLSKTFESIQTKLTSMVENAPKRAIMLDD